MSLHNSAQCNPNYSTIQIQQVVSAILHSPDGTTAHINFVTLNHVIIHHWHVAVIVQLYIYGKKVCVVFKCHAWKGLDTLLLKWLAHFLLLEFCYSGCLLLQHGRQMLLRKPHSLLNPLLQLDCCNIDLKELIAILFILLPCDARLVNLHKLYLK